MDTQPNEDTLFQLTSQTDVVRLLEPRQPVGQTAMVEDVLTAFVSYLTTDTTGWVKDGIPCQLLSAQHGQWRAGKIRLAIEFVPD